MEEEAGEHFLEAPQDQAGLEAVALDRSERAPQELGELTLEEEAGELVDLQEIQEAMEVAE